jgi:hypothetical protein
MTGIAPRLLVRRGSLVGAAALELEIQDRAPGRAPPAALPLGRKALRFSWYALLRSARRLFGRHLL